MASCTKYGYPCGTWFHGILFVGLLHLSLPAPVVEFAGIVGNANAFMAMLMIGVGFHLNGDPSQIGDIGRNPLNCFSATG